MLYLIKFIKEYIAIPHDKYSEWVYDYEYVCVYIKKKYLKINFYMMNVYQI